MSSLNPTSPAFEKATPNDHGVSLTLVNCVLIVLSGLVVISRALVRLRNTNLTALDDIAIALALVFAVAQTVCMQFARNNGVGKHRDMISSHDFFEYSKFNYASQLLTILTLLFAKLAVSQLIISIRPQRLIHIVCHVLDGVIVAWAFTSILILAFQCSLPRPWLFVKDRCVDLQSLYQYVGVMNILTDVALVILPFFLVWDLQMAKRRKILVVALFAIRMLVPCAVIVQLALLQPFLNALNADQTWKAVNPAIINQVVVNISVITACIPSLRRMVTELYTNQTGLAVTKDLELTVGSEGQHSNAATSSVHRNAIKSDSRFQTSTRSLPHGHNLNGQVGNVAMIYSPIVGKGKRRRLRSSEEQLRQDGIVCTTEVDVEEDDTGSTPSIPGEMKKEREM